MPQRPSVPFNIRILELTDAKLSGVRPVTSLDIFESAGSQNFHPDGFYSPVIFGRVGDENRAKRFSYIDIKIPIMHPMIYRTIVKLKQLYGDILSGKEYAVFNPDIQDFERSNATDGQTGYQFFLSKWRDIKFEPTKSTERSFNIRLIQQSYDVALTSRIIVMPAALRDMEFDGQRFKSDEINSLYWQLLSTSNTINLAAIRNNPEALNVTRISLQNKFNAIYDMIERMVEGKEKLLMSKFASRRIQDGTRNVITAMATSTPVLGGEGNVGFNNTVIGLYQMLKASRPIAIYSIKNGFLQKVFPSVSMPAMLVNKKTLHAEGVMLKPQYYDRWATDEGLEKVLTSYGNEDVRHRPLEIEGRYMGLIYKGPDMSFKIFQDIDELPEGFDPKYVSPLTFTELLYYSTYRSVNGLPLHVTRYPITGLGSIYPSFSYIKTTVLGEVRKELDENWEPYPDNTHTAYQCPIAGMPFINSLVPHSARLTGLGADFDGDTASGNVTYSDESIAEVKQYLASRRAYIGPDGRFLASTAIDTINLVCFNMTGN